MFVMQRNELYGKIIHSETLNGEDKQRAVGLLMDITTLNQSSEAILALNRDWRIGLADPAKLTDRHDPRLDRYWKLLSDARKTILEMETVLYKYQGKEVNRDDSSLPPEDSFDQMEERLSSLSQEFYIDTNIEQSKDKADDSEVFEKAGEDHIDTDKIDISHV